MATESKTIVRQNITIEDLKRINPSQFAAQGTIRFPNPLNKEEIIKGQFTILDGVAVGKTIIDGEEKEVWAKYPLQQFVNKTAKNMKENIQKFQNIEEDRDVTIFEILASYGRFTLIN